MSHFPFPSLLTFPFIFSLFLFVASFRVTKALFNQFNGAHSKDKVKHLRDSDSDSPFAPSHQREKSPQLPPLRECSPSPPPLDQPHSSIDATTSITSYKPLSEPSTRPLLPIEDTLVPFADYGSISIPHSRSALPDVAEEDSVDTAVITHTASPRIDQDPVGRSSCRIGDGSITTTNGSNDIPKRAAFLFHLPTSSRLNVHRPLQEDVSTLSTVVRSQPSHQPRGSMSTAASDSRPDVGSNQNSTQTVETTSTRLVTSPNSAKPAYGDGASIDRSLRPVIPFSIGSVLPPASWSEGVEEDLLANLGSHERTRQEALWEIAASEERYDFCPCLLNKIVNCPDMSPSCLR